MALSMWDVPITEHVYTFVDHNKQATHIAASTLYAAIKRAYEAKGWEPMQPEISGSLIAALQRGDLGVEEPHALRLAEAALDVPILVCEWGDSHVIADGAHRLWRRWKRGDKTFPCYLVPEPLWRMYTIHDMPGTGEEWDAFNRNAKIRDVWG